MVEIFTNTWGMDSNLGDVVLRRQFLQCLRRYGRLHLLTGGMSDSYIEAIVGAGDVLYDDLSDWRRKCAQMSSERSVLFVERAGEITPTWQSFRYLFRHRLLINTLKRRGGRAAVLGLGARYAPNRLKKYAFKWAFSAHDLVLWRDPMTRDAFGIGSTMPDWAFSLDIEPCSESRDLLVLSLRNDRPQPSETWVSLVERYATERQLSIRVVSQVEPDNASAMTLAARFGGVATCYLDSPDFEREVVAIYGRAALVISDRLHVLILGALAGAPPLCLTEFEEKKVGRHFDEIDFPRTTFVRSGADLDAAGPILSGQMARQSEIVRCVENARREVHRAESALLAVLTGMR